MVIHEAVVIQVGIADRSEFRRPEFDKEMMPFLDNRRYIAEIAEEVVNLSDLYVAIIVEI